MVWEENKTLNVSGIYRFDLGGIIIWSFVFNNRIFYLFLGFCISVVHDWFCGARNSSDAKVKVEIRSNLNNILSWFSIQNLQIKKLQNKIAQNCYFYLNQLILSTNYILFLCTFQFPTTAIRCLFSTKKKIILNSSQFQVTSTTSYRIKAKHANFQMQRNPHHANLL